jgi:hypothetical protein
MTQATKNSFDSPEGENHRFVIIPDDHEKTGVIPIGICLTDHRGNPVNHGWIEAVRPIAEPLRYLARVIMQDVRRVSELAEGSVHALSARFGAQLGRSPSMRIWVDAKWRARDLAAGSRKARKQKQKEVPLSDHTKGRLKESYDFVKAVENRDLVERLFERFRQLGYSDAIQMMEMYMSDSNDRILWSDPAIAKLFGAESKRARNTRSAQFWRWRKKALEVLRDLDHERAA